MYMPYDFEKYGQHTWLLIMHALTMMALFPFPVVYQFLIFLTALFIEYVYLRYKKYWRRRTSRIMVAAPAPNLVREAQVVDVSMVADLAPTASTKSEAISMVADLALAVAEDDVDAPSPVQSPKPQRVRRRAGKREQRRRQNRAIYNVNI